MVSWNDRGVVRPLSLDFQGEVVEEVEEVVLAVSPEDGGTATSVSAAARKAALSRRVRRGVLLARFANTCHHPAGSHEGGQFCDADGVPSSGGSASSSVPKGPFPAEEFNAKGKPIPGTDAWLHAHNISPAVWEDRPYTRFEAGAAFESLPPSVQALYADEPEAKRQLLKMMAQTGGLIMVRKVVPGAESVVPQTRPDDPVVTDMGKRAFRATSLANANKRLEQMKALSGKDDLVALQEGRVERAKANLEAAATMDRDKFLEYARGRVAEADGLVAAASEGLPQSGSGRIKLKELTTEQAETLEFARAQKVKAEKSLADATNRADYNFGSPVDRIDKKGKVIPANTPDEIAKQTARYREVETNNATKALARSEKKLEKIQGLDEDGVKAQIAQEIETAAGFQAKAQNAYDKTAAKYLFPPNPADEKDAIAAGKLLGKAGRVNVHGEQNVKNLVEGKGRVYLAMEGAQKEDSLLTAVANEAEGGGCSYLCA